MTIGTRVWWLTETETGDWLPIKTGTRIVEGVLVSDDDKRATVEVEGWFTNKLVYVDSSRLFDNRDALVRHMLQSMHRPTPTKAKR
jgi:hypothetical protein